MLEDMLDDESNLPSYTIKIHIRAKRVKLKMSAQKGLEVIVPPHFNVKYIPGILLENKKWIDKQLTQFAERHPKTKKDILPDHIALPAIKQNWKIYYIESKSALSIITRPQHEIVLLGRIKNTTACKKLLVVWLKKLAKIHLAEKLAQVSKMTRLSYTKLTVRDQKTRWGSCTSNKAISLNYKILFLPPHLATHILIHELCHTVHMDHSSKFWRLVAKFDPEFEQHRQTVRQIDECIPSWIAYL